jgi:uncharacterized RDD family membrane protein YckC
MPCTTHPSVLENLNACSRCAKSFCADCLVELKSNRFCASCKSEAVKDMQSGVSGTDLPLATVGRRFAAIIVDGLIQMVVYVPLMFVFGFFAVKAQQAGGSAEVAAGGMQLILQVAIMGVSFAYEGLFLQLKGATPGKMALGLKVVGADGNPLAPGQAWIRPLVRTLLGFCALIDYIPAFLRKDRCTVHDLAARTRVIKVN